MPASKRLLYISGLGDGYDPLRRTLLRHWRRDDLEVELYSMKWSDMSEAFDQKLADLKHALRNSDQTIIVVGESAGGSVVMGLLAEFPDKISLAITLCGKNQYADRVSSRLYDANPAFKESMQRADEAVKSLSDVSRQKLHIFYSKADPTVQPIDTIVAGAALHTLPVPGHLFAIFAGLTYFKRRLLTLVVAI